MPRVIFESITIHAPKEAFHGETTERKKTILLGKRDYFGCWQYEEIEVIEFPPIIRRRGPRQSFTVLHGDRVRRIATRDVYHRARIFRGPGTSGMGE